MTSSPTSSTNYPAADIDLPSIAFCGKAGAGKTTASEMLEELGYECHSLAAPLKQAANLLWPSAVDRENLQRLGRAVRAIYEDTFVDALSTRLGGRVGCGEAVDDLRYPNEFWALKGQGFTIVRITAERRTRVDRLKANGRFQTEEQLDDASEVALDDVRTFTPDYVIANDGPKAKFFFGLVDIVSREMRRR